MKSRLEGRTALVTGAGRGLGRVISVALAREGVKVWNCARTKSELDKTAAQIQEIKGDVESRTVNLEDERAVLELVAEVKEKSHAIDILVNNAGVLQLTPFSELSTNEWSQTLAVNLTAPYLLIRAALPEMKERGGSIINVSSRAGVLGFKDEVAYCSSKFGLEGLTRALAMELEEYPVSINTVTPGLRIKPTSLSEEEFEKLPPEKKAEWNDPEALTPAFTYLAGLRGEVNGLRFDAQKLSEAIGNQETTLTPEQTRELAE